VPKQSAGLLLFRRKTGLEVFLVHPGGPFFAKKDAGAWTIPKGEFNDEEVALAAAQREFLEETSFPPRGPFLPLGSVKQSGGKLVHAWGCEGDLDPEKIESNTFTIEWPPKSDKQREFPEVDRAGWFSVEAAAEKINAAQIAFLERLRSLVDESSPPLVS